MEIENKDFLSATHTTPDDKVGNKKGAGHALSRLRARTLGSSHDGNIEDIESSHCCAIVNATKQ